MIQTVFLHILWMFTENKVSKKNLLKIQKEWYKKLKSEGFDDIETLLPNGEFSTYTKNAAGVNGHKYRKDFIESKQSHFINAAKYYTDNKDWDESYEKEVWKLYSEGVPYRKIISLMSKTKKLSLEKVSKIINKYRPIS